MAAVSAMTTPVVMFFIYIDGVPKKYLQVYIYLQQFEKKHVKIKLNSYYRLVITINWL